MNTLEGKSKIEYLKETLERGRQHYEDSGDSDEGIFIEIDIDTLITINDLLDIQNKSQSYIKRALKKEATLQGFIHEAINREIERISINNLLYSASKNIRLRKPNSEIKNRFRKLMEKVQIKQTDLSKLTGISNSELSIILKNERPVSM